MSKTIEIYTDGGCHGNPGPGAWAFIISFEDTQVVESGFEQLTTNNRMELTAVIRALEHVRAKGHCRKHDIAVYTDSQYVQRGISQWIAKWEQNGWKTAAKKPVKNKDLWVRLQAVNTECGPRWNWVKGHSGVVYNERCDELIQKTIKNGVL